MFTTDATHLYQIMNCNGSRLLPAHERPDEQDTTLRDEGNAAHWFAQECFEGRLDVNDVRLDLKAYNGVMITPIMFDHVREYLYALTPGTMEAVTSWGMPEWFQINGRVDHIGYDAATDTLDIDDLKYGYRLVEPEYNWTLISHAIFWCITNGRYPAMTRIRIHQPRPYHPLGPMREWSLTDTQLEALHRQIIKTMSNPTDMLQTGNHCFGCNKRGECPAFRAATMSAIDILEHAYSDNLSDDALAEEYKLTEYASKIIKYRLDALKDMATYRARNGKVLPGLALERTYSNTTWKKHITPSMAQALTGRDLTVPKMCSPTEAKARGVPELVLKGMTDRIETGVKLVISDINAKMNKFTKE